MTVAEHRDTQEGKKSVTGEQELSLPAGASAASDSHAGLPGMEHGSSRAAESTGARPGWPVVDWLPVPLAVGLPVPGFRVRDLLTLEVGSVVSTDWPNGDDLPLSAGAVQLAWVDMEAVEQAMAVRLTRLL